MTNVKEYILSILAIAVIISIFTRLMTGRKTISAILRTVGSISIILAAISPLIRVRLENMSNYMWSIKSDASYVVEEAKLNAANDTAAIITEKIESYISDKAAAYGADITAVVNISNFDSLIPDSIKINGQLSPHTKEILQNIISEELGIQEEKQIWN